MSCQATSLNTISIAGTGILNIVKRADGTVIGSLNLNSNVAKITKSGNDFCIVGSADVLDGFTAVTPLSGNTVTLSTGDILQNIGSGKTIDIASYNAYIQLDNKGNLNFYEIAI